MQEADSDGDNSSMVVVDNGNDSSYMPAAATPSQRIAAVAGTPPIESRELRQEFMELRALFQSRLFDAELMHG
jgi:hypothetical protein